MLKKVRSGLLACIGYGFLLISIYYIHIRYFYVDVVFYSALLDVFIATFISALILYKHFSNINLFEKILIINIWILAGYSIVITVPTVIDRSLSFYILEKLQQRGGEILESDFERIFTVEYAREHRLVDVRLTEQLESGTIEINNGCVILTGRGESLASFSRYFRQNLLPKKRLLMGEYSSDLTDPFRVIDSKYREKCSETFSTR